ncbi:copper homeostasis protein CutC [Propioniciclava soli]|uniref:Copper homeostasis protein cutC homolog n=1 Tax=Propioniciclava soli TaxID=2775081 RepID=A0ABZ3CAB1_9ACTN|nr:copper homeostasis protein CutC [Propioniciclava soli]
MSGLLEVRILGAHDAAPAEAGGADRLELVTLDGEEALSPEPREMAAVRSRTTLPVRPVLRLREGFSTDGGEAVRLRGLISAYRDAGADGFVLGFVNGLGEVDVEVLGTLLEDTPGPWTFSRAVDSCLSTDDAWDVLRRLPGLDSVRTAGSARSLEHGLDDLVRRASADAAVAALVVADGDLHPDHVPWLARAGVRQFHVDDQVRPGGSRKAWADEALVGSWRRLIDTEVTHAR